MATDVILPALGMAQETGKIVRWLKSEGQAVTQGEPLAEIETDKATVEIEAPAAGLLASLRAAPGDEVPVGSVIAAILADGELPEPHRESHAQQQAPIQGRNLLPLPATGAQQLPAVTVSPLASRIASEHKLDLSRVKPAGKRIQKADVLTYLQNQQKAGKVAAASRTRLTPASPKARRLATEQGKDLAQMPGSGPGGAVLAADVMAMESLESVAPGSERAAADSVTQGLTISNIWRIMAERTTQSWTSVPHFYLVREVNASRLSTWREQAQKHSAEKITYTDLLVKLVAAALRLHPRLNATWNEGTIFLNAEINIGLAVAVEEGLVVPVISQADRLSLSAIAAQRKDLATRAKAAKLRPQDIRGGTFTISNMGMYGVDAFNAIINSPQVAILAIGRIVQRVVPIHGQPLVQPVMVFSLSCDHRALDGARGAQFLETLAELVEEPLGLLS